MAKAFGEAKKEKQEALIAKLKNKNRDENGKLIRLTIDSDTLFLVALDCATQVAMGRHKPAYQEIATKYNIPLLSVKRIWKEVPHPIKEKLILHSDDVMKNSVVVMVKDKAEQIAQLEEKTITLAHKASDILMERMQLAPQDIADKDLIALLTRVLSMAKENHIVAEQGCVQRTGNIYNIIDQSITNNYEQEF